MTGPRTTDPNGGEARQRWRPPMKEDRPAPPDPDRPYLALYVTLVTCMTSLGDKASIKAWIAQNKAAFDALSQGSPERARMLRDIYALHVLCLDPQTVQAAPAAPALVLPASDMVDGILQGAGDDT